MKTIVWAFAALSVLGLASCKGQFTIEGQCSGDTCTAVGNAVNPGGDDSTDGGGGAGTGVDPCPDDLDHDGFCNDLSCCQALDCPGAEENRSVYPGAPEICDGRDNDCDGLFDEGVLNNCGTCSTTCNVSGCPADFDGDGRCNAPGCCPFGSDCGGAGEFDAHVYPFAAETCDNKDNDCDGQTDEGVKNSCGNCDNNTCIANTACPGGEDPDGDKYCAAACCNVGTPTGLGRDCTDNSGEGDISKHPGATELCDYKDNDCDGQVDEGVVNACGTCDNTCNAQTIGEGGSGGGGGGGGGAPFPAPDGDDQGVVLVTTNCSGPPNTCGITVTSTQQTTQFAWPSNSAEGTISKLNTVRNLETARYATVLKIAGSPAVPEWNATSTRNVPSRSTVDLSGNAYIGNRLLSNNSGANGSVTKIGNYDPILCTQADLSLCECKDRNNNGTIETSLDCNGYGIVDVPGQPVTCTSAALTVNPGETPNGIDINNPREFLAYNDECLLWTTVIPAVIAGTTRTNAWVRALATDGSGFIWAGDWNNKRFYKLNQNGVLLTPNANLPGQLHVSVDGNPYGAVISAQGMLWYMNGYNTGKIQSVDTITGVKVSGLIPSSGAVGGYGITIDRLGNVWMASYNEKSGSNGGTTSRYDPVANTWSFPTAGLGGSWNGRGITASAAGAVSDGSGVVWAAFHSGSTTRIVGFSDTTLQPLIRIPTTTATGCNGLRAIGVGLGPAPAGAAVAHSVWSVNQDSNNACRFDPPALLAANSGNNAVTSGGTLTTVRIGNGPYTYSDFTGNILRTFTNPQGTYKTVLLPCPNQPATTVWERLDWSATLVGTSDIVMRYRNASSLSELANAAWSGGFTSSSAQASVTLDSKLGYMEVEFTLRPDQSIPGSPPILHGFSAIRQCVPIGGG